MKSCFRILFLLLLPILMLAQSTVDDSASPSIAVKAVSALNLISDFDEAFLGFGLGAEARLGNKFTIGANMTFGGDDRLNFTMVHPNVRFYPSQAFKGFFLKAGFGYAKFNSKEENLPIGPPISITRGASAGLMTVEAGLGLNTLVKEHWMIGFSFALTGSLDGDIEDAGIHSNISIGYAF